MHISYPFQVDDRGRVMEASEATHIRQMIEQVLFTAPGERVNRPTFGTGIRQLIFSPNSAEVATATELMVRAALEQWLGDWIEIEGLEVIAEESTLGITIQYVIRRSQQREIVEFSRNG